MRKFVLPLAAVVLTTGCIGMGPTRISYRDVDTAYTLNEFNAAGASGEMRTIVLGDPFGIGRERFGEAVSDAMYGHHFGIPVEFATGAAENANRHYKVVMAFDAPVGQGSASLCGVDADEAAQQPSSARGEDRMHVVAAFCRGGIALTHLSGELAGATGPDDPAFQGFVAQVTSLLFPLNNPDAPNRDGREIFIPG